jgi:hypothetical protein
MSFSNKFIQAITFFLLLSSLTFNRTYVNYSSAYGVKCCLGFMDFQQATNTVTETQTLTPSPTSTPTLTSTPSGSETATPTGSVTTSITPSITGSITPLVTQTETPSPTPTATGIPTGTPTSTLPTSITASATLPLPIETSAEITATVKYKPLPLITYQYPQITQTDVLLKLEHQPDEPGTTKAGASTAWTKVARLWPLGLLLLVWLGLAAWFVFAQRN